MAKKETKEAPNLTKKQMALSKPDRERQRWILIAAGGVAALIVLVFVVGIVQTYVLEPQAPVAKVNGVAVAKDLYQKTFRFRNYQSERDLQQLQQQAAQFAGDEKQKQLYDYFQQQISQMQGRQFMLPQEVLNTMIDQELVRQEASRRGLSASPEEIQTELGKQLGYDRNPPTPTATPTLTASQVITLTPTPTATPVSQDEFKRRYDDLLQQYVKIAAFTEADFRQLFSTELLAQKVRDKLESEVPAAGAQARSRHILIAPKPIQPKEGATPTPDEQAKAVQAADEEANAKALAVLKRVTDGKEDFATVAKEVSDDPGSKAQGGDLDWHPRGDMVPEFDNVAFSLKPGQIFTDVVKTQFGYHIIKLDEFDANRPLSADALQAKKSQAFQDWLSTQRNTAKIEQFLTSDVVPKVSPPSLPRVPASP